MLAFENDYAEGAHEAILHRLLATNMEQVSGYGYDPFTAQAIQQIKEAVACPTASVRLLTGGTQTNQLVISALLKRYQGVLAAETGHISTHEAGAIEFTGHKVLTLPAKEGKIDAETVTKYLTDFYNDESHEHMVFPGMVYISYPTEYGTLYSNAELRALYQVCQDHQLPLFIDGARLGYGLTSEASDLSLSDLAQLCDVFYIGGTKIGALCGEAVVFTKNNEPAYFMTLIKQQGALLAKGRLLGIQFLELFTDNLYLTLSRHANHMAQKLKAGFLAKGYQLYLDSPTNQQFFILSNEKVVELQPQVKFACWEKYDAQHYVVRFATSWATTEAQVEALLKLM